MRVLVMGAGAIGSVAGGMLARAGHQVSLVGRGPHMTAVSQKGLLIRGVLGEYHASGMDTYTRAEDLPAAAFNVVLITTKTYDTETAVRQAIPVIGPDTLVISMQNGLGNVETIASVVGDRSTASGRVMYGAELKAPGVVEVTVMGDDIIFGSPGDIIPIGRIEKIAGAFRAAGLPASASHNITGYLWGKLLFNCSLNPLSAILGVSYGKLGEDPDSRIIMSEVIKETFAVAAAVKQTLLWKTPGEYQKLLFEQLIPRTTAHFASMYSDLRLGKRTEIDALNGAVCRLGQQNVVPTPVNACLTLMIKAKEKMASPAQ